MRARSFGHSRLLRPADGGDHDCAQRIAPLAEQLPNAASARMHEDHVASLHRKRAAKQVLRGEAFQHHTCSGLVGNAIGKLHENVCADHALLRIAAKRRRVANAIANLEALHIRPDLDDLASGFIAKHERRRRFIGASAKIRVDVIQPDGAIAHAHLASAGRAHGHVFDAHNVRPAGLVDDDCFHHGRVPFIKCISAMRAL